LRNALRSIEASSQLPAQVIVSDDGVDGRTAEGVVAEFSFVKYQRGPRVGLGANRNACLALVKSAFVCFIDDDVVLPASFLPLAHNLCRTNAAKINPPLVSGIEFKQSVPGENPIRVEPHNADFWGYQRVPPVGNLKAMVINAGIFPTELFSKAQFDSLLWYGSEEIDMIRHAYALGYRVVFEPELWVSHYPSPVNRAEYTGFVDASRMYSTAKNYLCYQKDLFRFSLFCVLAPLKLVLALTRRSGFRGFSGALHAIALAAQYGFRSSMLNLIDKVRSPAR
jgi:glycosyltransferase involved in cell wall biosynthesis